MTPCPSSRVNPKFTSDSACCGVELLFPTTGVMCTKYCRFATSIAGMTGKWFATGDYSDHTKSTSMGVDVATVAAANRCTPAFAFAFATAGTPHSAPPGGNSSHIDPDV